MDWQTYTAAGIVATTVLIFLIRLVRRPTSGGCGSSCGCDHHKADLPSDSGLQRFESGGGKEESPSP